VQGPANNLVLVALRVAFCLGVILGASVLAGVFIQLNLQLDSTIPWFILPVAVISLTTLRWTERFAERLPRAGRGGFARLAAWSLVLSIVLAAVALVSMGLSPLRQGRLLLPGDLDAAPPIFRSLHALVLLAYVGPVEEGAVRNIVQLKLQTKMRPLLAEMIAGALFVLIHVTYWRIRGELPLVILLALVSGRLAAITQNARYSALVHSLSNLGIGAAVLLLR
jgi:membrane protease YdiL (CAAX protease family)